jgi:Co/Zn/Cd efflux system component
MKTKKLTNALLSIILIVTVVITAEVVYSFFGQEKFIFKIIFYIASFAVVISIAGIINIMRNVRKKKKTGQGKE